MSYISTCQLCQSHYIIDNILIFFLRIVIASAKVVFSFIFYHGCTRLFICTYNFVHPSMHPCMHSSSQPCIHPCIHPCMDACMHPCMHAYIHPSMCQSMCQSILVNTYTVYVSDTWSCHSGTRYEATWPRSSWSWTSSGSYACTPRGWLGPCQQ